MTELPDLQLNKNSAAAQLTPSARRVQLAVLTSFAETGRPPARTELLRLAGDLGTDPAAALAELADRDVVAFDAHGEIRAAYPFSPTPTAIRVTWGGGPTVYAMCAVDALGMSAMLGRPVTITATEPDDDRVVTVEVDGDRAAWTPDTAVVFAGTTGDACCPSVDRTCSTINFFTTHEAARRWAHRHPDVTGSLLDQPEALACGITEFGALLRVAP
ncbi:alkylmercury lyase family protein [Jiangella alkaliphila]|uniref:Alkylmercury lyase n=1 Tax=Jiangella alkaliphila TaxID=419479 RepID=A0A1H2GZD3_9ACTN|nr:alkylmercury lyase family protein [Jiangella alkaliphila]SDU24993.1 Alkylmercury lyase [Jiangella alkaliphila]